MEHTAGKLESIVVDLEAKVVNLENEKHATSFHRHTDDDGHGGGKPALKHGDSLAAEMQGLSDDEEAVGHNLSNSPSAEVAKRLTIDERKRVTIDERLGGTGGCDYEVGDTGG